MSVFFTSRKTGFKSWLDTSSIPCCLSSFFSFFLSHSQQLLDTWWIDRESSYLLDSSWIDRASFLAFDGLFLDTSLIPVSVDDHLLDTYFDSFLDTWIYRALLRTYIFVLHDPILISSISLDLSTSVHLPNTISLTPNFLLCDFSRFFKIFFSW